MSEYSSHGEEHPPPLVARLIGTGCFVGYIPWASGTFGTLLGCLILLIPGVWQPRVLSPLTAVVFALGVWSAASIARFEGNRLSATAARAKERFQHGRHPAPDPSIVVVDEIAGMWISVLFLPPSMPALAVAFVLFRIFDILKPPPAAWLERIPQGWGIMLDDLVAGLYANVCTRLVLLLASILHVL
ncbi:MAG TPA: phosphatidylglycerophosphatase A [Bacteroidota bacterium]|nr:phosphatidylglycerophosphatase A [Bacteroidota bacterium]